MKTVFAAASLLVFAVTTANAHDYKIGQLEITHPWTRATPKGAAVAGGYLKVKNTGTVSDRLIGGSVPVAGRFEVHEMAMNNGVMTMRPLKDGLEIKPGQTIELKPGSYHVMFMDLKQPLNQGQPLKGTLVFEKAGTLEIEYKIEAIGAKASGDGGHSH